MSVALMELLTMAERGKAGKRGLLKSVPRGLWGYNPYYDNNCYYDYEGKHRDKTELIEGGFNYYLWDYLLMSKKQNIITLYSWDSATTQDRLNDISSYYHLPIRFTFKGQELYCLFGWSMPNNEWRYNKIEIDTIKRTIKIYIDNDREDIEKYNY